MPRYPTNLKRGSARPAPAQPPGRGTPKPRWPVPKPGNDNPKHRVPIPANDNKRKPWRNFPLRKPSRLPLSPLLFLPLGGAIIDGYLRSPTKVPWPVFPPGNWILKHGPNTYPGSTYNREPSIADDAYQQFGNDPSVWGPETGKITGQARTLGRPVPSAPESHREDWGYWIRSDTAPRYAQYLAWIQLRRPRHEYSPEIQDLFRHHDNMKPNPVPGVPDILPPQFPFPDPSGLPLNPYPIPRSAPPVRPMNGDPDPQLPPQPAPRFRNDFHPPKPPGSNTKERKGRLRRGFDTAMNIFGAVTEIQDIIDAAWKALPDRCRTKVYYRGKVVTGFQDRWADVYRCAPHLDINEFIKHLFNNHFQDLVIGLQNRMRNEILPDGVNGVDLLRWLDEFLFDGELGRQTDLSKYLYQLETEYSKGKGK